MKKIPWCTVALVLALAIPAQAASTQWLHVRVESDKNETVRVNVPLSVVDSVLPIIEREIGKELKLEEHEITVQDLRNIWTTLTAESNADLVTVDTPDAKVRVSLVDGHVLVQADEDSKTKVDIKLPVAVVDALLSNEDNTLNLTAAIQALKKTGGQDLVSVQDEENIVRVWIDGKNGSES